MARIWFVMKATLATIMFVMLMGLVLWMFFGGPLEVLTESYDLVRMDRSTEGRLHEMRMVQGGKGTSGVRVNYEFKVDGKSIESTRLYPGITGSSVSYTGAGGLARKYVVGKPVTVYYNSAKPSVSCLEHGWNKWSIGYSAFVWGMLGYIVCQVRKLNYALIPLTMLLYGFGLLALGPHTVRVEQVHWHVLAFLGIGAALMVKQYVAYQVRRQSPTAEGDRPIRD